MSRTLALDPVGPTPVVASSAVVLGEARLGAGVMLAQGLVMRSHGGSVYVGNHSAVLENGVVIGTPEHPVWVGQRTVFGHRCQVIGATVGNLCEISNGTILLPGSQVGDGCFLGEGALVPAGLEIPPNTVLVGRPVRVLRQANWEDRARLERLREGQMDLTYFPAQTVRGEHQAGAEMGKLYAYREKQPLIAPTALLFDSAEITGDVTVGADTIIGAGVKIIGDSHGPVRIGARVQILENTVLHLLPDNELIVEDDVVIGPGAMIHGCHIGAGSVIEPAAIVCDWSTVGPNSLVTAGSVVVQRAHFGPNAVLQGFPAEHVGRVAGRQPLPSWALRREDLPSLVRIR